MLRDTCICVRVCVRMYTPMHMYAPVHVHLYVEESLATWYLYHTPHGMDGMTYLISNGLQVYCR